MKEPEKLVRRECTLAHCCLKIVGKMERTYSSACKTVEYKRVWRMGRKRRRKRFFWGSLQHIYFTKIFESDLPMFCQCYFIFKYLEFRHLFSR